MTEQGNSPLMKGSTEYTAFVSYSWTSEKHQQWVLELATRLRADGVNVIFDVRDLQLGQNKYVFMEKTVLDDAIKKVLISKHSQGKLNIAKEWIHSTTR